MNVHSKYYPVIDVLSSPPPANYQTMDKKEGEIGDTPGRGQGGVYPWKMLKKFRGRVRGMKVAMESGVALGLSFAVGSCD